MVWVSRVISDRVVLHLPTRSVKELDVVSFFFILGRAFIDPYSHPILMFLRANVIPTNAEWEW